LPGREQRNRLEAAYIRGGQGRAAEGRRELAKGRRGVIILSFETASEAHKEYC
jgi:hypothetical protein